MAQTWQNYPSALAMGSSVFGISVLIGIILALVYAMLGLQGSGSGVIATMVAGMSVGQFCAARVGDWMPKGTRWQVAAWATLWALLVFLGLVGLAQTTPGSIEGLESIGVAVLLVVFLIVAAIALPLTYFGLWLGERGAIKQLERRSAKSRS